MSRLASLRARLRRNMHLRRDDRGAAAVEFAYVLPLLVALVTGGVETTNYAWTRMQVSQLALHAADHASRMGTSAVLKNVPVYEDDISDVLIGTALEGENLDLLTNGRVIISSLQRNGDGGQWIAWQRCHGRSDMNSNWGAEGEGASGTSFGGMGWGGSQISATENEAVMVAEVHYEYQPLFPVYDSFIPEKTFLEIAAFNVRDDRDLTQIYTTDGAVEMRC